MRTDKESYFNVNELEKMIEEREYGIRFEPSIIGKLKDCCKTYEKIIDEKVPEWGEREVEEFFDWKQTIESLTLNEIEDLIFRIDENSYQNPVINETYGKLLELKDILDTKIEDYTKAICEIKNSIPLIKECAFAIGREDCLNEILEAQKRFMAQTKDTLQRIVYLDMEETGEINHLTQNALNSFNFKVDSQHFVKEVATMAKFVKDKREKSLHEEKKTDRSSIKDKLLKNLKTVKKNDLEKNESKRSREEVR